MSVRLGLHADCNYLFILGSVLQQNGKVDMTEEFSSRGITDRVFFLVVVRPKLLVMVGV